MSETSARVGVGFWIIDSSMLVATMTGFPRLRQPWTMRDCQKGTSSTGSSAPFFVCFEVFWKRENGWGKKSEFFFLFSVKVIPSPPPPLSSSLLPLSFQEEREEKKNSLSPLLTKVPASHHRAVDSIQDLLEVVDRVRRLDLCQHADLRPLLRQIALELVDHVGVAHERQRVVVDAHVDAELQVEPVLVCDGRQVGRFPPDVEVAARLDRAAVDDLALDVAVRLGHDAEALHPPVDEQRVPDRDVVDEAIVVDRDAAPGAVGPLVDGKSVAVPLAHLDRSDEVSRPHLWPFRVEHDREAPSPQGVVLLDEVDHGLVGRVVPVAHVEPGDVHPGVGEREQALALVGRRADGADDLGLARQRVRVEVEGVGRAQEVVDVVRGGLGGEAAARRGAVVAEGAGAAVGVGGRRGGFAAGRRRLRGGGGLLGGRGGGVVGELDARVVSRERRGLFAVVGMEWKRKRETERERKRESKRKRGREKKRG